jgi:hypothetical protein
MAWLLERQRIRDGDEVASEHAFWCVRGRAHMHIDPVGIRENDLPAGLFLLNSVKREFWDLRFEVEFRSLFTGLFLLFAPFGH